MLEISQKPIKPVLFDMVDLNLTVRTLLLTLSLI